MYSEQPPKPLVITNYQNNPFFLALSSQNITFTTETKIQIMKKYLLVFSFLFCAVVASAEVSLTVNVATAGTFKTALKTAAI